MYSEINLLEKCPRGWYARQVLGYAQKPKIKIIPAQQNVYDTVAGQRRFLKTWEEMPEARYERHRIIPVEDKSYIKAYRIIRNAVKNETKVFVYADYDCDGNIFAGIIVRALEYMGHPIEKTEVFTPLRSDGYGLRIETLEKYNILERLSAGDVLIVGDLGINDYDAWELIPPQIHTICIDHHLALKDTDTQRADVVIHDTSRCAAGLAFRLAMLISRGKLKEELLPWAALATVGDVSPLCDDNHVLAREGLALLNQGKIPDGIQALIDASAEYYEASTNEYNWHTLAFGLAPMINAANRMLGEEDGCRPDLGHKLVISSTSANDKKEVAKTLAALNETRKEQTASYVEEGKQNYVQDANFAYAIIDCPDGFMGLVASRLMEQLVPITTAVFAPIDENTYKGSFRGKGIHLGEIAKKINLPGVLFGGHRDAAGATVPAEHFETFVAEIKRLGKLFPVPSFQEFFELPDKLDGAKKLLEQGRPWGHENEEPYFVVPINKLENYRYYDTQNLLSKAPPHSWAITTLHHSRAGNTYLTIVGFLSPSTLISAEGFDKMAPKVSGFFEQANNERILIQEILEQGSSSGPESLTISPGACCKDCPQKTACAQERIQALEIPELSPAEMGEMILLLEEATKSLKKQLRVYVEGNGTVEVDGQYFGLFPRITKVYDIQAFMNILANAGLDPLEYMSVNGTKTRKLQVDVTPAIIEEKREVTFTHRKNPPA